MKALAIKIGSVIATLWMFSPLVILSQYNELQTLDFIFFFIISIFYDVYMYSVITKSDNHVKEHYYKFVKDADKKLNLEISYKDKYENLEKFVEDLLDRYF